MYLLVNLVGCTTFLIIASKRKETKKVKTIERMEFDLQLNGARAASYDHNENSGRYTLAKLLPAHSTKKEDARFFTSITLFAALNRSLLVCAILKNILMKLCGGQ